MIESKVEIDGKFFIRLKLTQVTQGGKSFFICIIPAKTLLKLYTVAPVEYDIEKEVALQKAFPDMQEYFEASLTEKKKYMERGKGFQREANIDRAKDIAHFLEKEEYPFFPNSIIATCDIFNEIGEDATSPCISTCKDFLAADSNISFLQASDDGYELLVPDKPKSILIIDGQHRLEGLKLAPTNAIDNYDLIVSLILEYDRSVIAKLFYTINYTQKSVNKSLLYHLTAEFSEKLDETTFLHEIVKSLNESSKSPFFKRIKMLGVAPKGIGNNQKNMMTISQAFLIDYLSYTIKDINSKSTTQPIFSFYYKNNYKYEILRFLVSYFIAVKNIITLWDSPDKSIISKSMGVGALLKLMNYLFIKLFYEYNLDNDPLRIREIKSSHIQEKLSGIEDVSIENFAGGSSAGSLNQLKKLFIEKIHYFDAKDYSEFEKEFKKEYALRFREWLLKN